jgi:hypothetical protein
MIKLNIKKDGKVKVKSFVKKIDLINYVLDFIGGGETVITTEKIWNLNVGTSITINNGWFETTISMSGKSPYHNTEHGKQMYGS